MAKKKAQFPIVETDVDDADGYAGNGNDGVYWQTAERRGKWYVTAWTDSHSGLPGARWVDRGPFTSKAFAYDFGRERAFEWCSLHGVVVRT